MAAKRLAVVAHAGKTLGGGLGELRRLLAQAGHHDPIWYEVPKSRKARKAVRRAVKKGARLIFVWGGDGKVQHCVDGLAGTKKVDLAIVPAGTANLLAANLGIPKQIAAAVRIGLRGARHRIDVGVVNGERFAVMAGAGFDAMIMRDVDGARKKRVRAGRQRPRIREAARGARRGGRDHRARACSPTTSRQPGSGN